MKTALIAGSSGMIGSLILKECLSRKDISRVTSIARKPTGIINDRLVEMIHNNFLDFTKIEDHFKNIDICFFCIGVYTGQVSPRDYRKITIDYTKAFAEILRKNNRRTTFCFLSGQGADSSEKSRVLFANAKGKAENILLQFQFNRTFIFRPGYIYPVTPRIEPNLMYKIMRKIYKPVSLVYPNIGVSSEKLASKMVEVGINGGDRIIYENKHIRD